MVEVALSEFGRDPLPLSSRSGRTIAVVGLRGIPSVMGGVESHCEELLPRVKALMKGCEIVVLARSPYVESKGRYRDVLVERVFAFRHKYIEAVLHTFLCVLYARFGMKCSLLHIHGIGPALLAPFARALGLRIVVTHHGEDFRREKWNWLGRAALRLGERCCVGYSHAAIVVSKAVARRLRADGTQAEIHYVPNGATVLARSAEQVTHQAVFERLGIQRGNYVLAVGRLVMEKNLHVLVEAFQASGRDCDLVIAGAADHQDEYAKALLGRGGGRIKFVGFQDHATIAALYAGAGLFVLPSSHEGLPIAALEAAAAGCPMLMSDIEPNLEIGLAPHNYVPVGDVGLLSERLREPFSRFAINSREIRARFDWDEVARRTAAIYSDVLDIRPAA